MNGLGLVYLILISLFIALFFSFVLRARGPWGNFWILFLILFLSVWAADLWVPLVGPSWGGIFWIRPLLVGVLIALLLAAAAPSPRARAKIEDENLRPNEDKPKAVALGIFFWMTLVVIIGLILAGTLINV